MAQFSRLTIGLFLSVLLLGALSDWLRLAEQAGFSGPGALRRLVLREALNDQASVRAELASTQERRRQTEELTLATLNGRVTLHEGAAQLRDLYRAAPRFPWATVVRRFPGASDEECCCRLLISEVRSLEGPQREQAQAVALRLETELEDELRVGSLSLPARAKPASEDGARLKASARSPQRQRGRSAEALADATGSDA